MGSRNVYRRLEDVLGVPQTGVRHPHTGLSQRLRADYRESRDIIRFKELKLHSLISLFGNSRMDIQKVQESVGESLADLRDEMFPYYATKGDKTDHPEEPKETDYERYFRILKEMEDEKKEQEAQRLKEIDKMNPVEIPLTRDDKVTRQKTGSPENGIMTTVSR